MRGEHHHADQLSTHIVSTLREYNYEAKQLPPSDEMWLRSELGLEQGPHQAFADCGAIQKAERDGLQHTRHYWRTGEGVYEWVQNHIETQNWTPCGHATGIRTIEPGTYTCTDDACDCRMSREEAEAVIA